MFRVGGARVKGLVASARTTYTPETANPKPGALKPKPYR